MRAWWQKLSFPKKIVAGIGVLSLVFLIAGCVLTYHFWFNKPRQMVAIDPKGNVVVTDAVSAPDLNSRINILVIGVDERTYSADKSYRTDTLILASIDPSSKQIALLSIPRDTRVEIPKDGLDKINAAAAYGGLNTTVAVVQQLTGVKIDGYIKTDFTGFKDVINTLGGITVNVEKDMYYLTGDKQDGVINLKQGVQVLDGTKALEYARFRHDALGDISRTARQQVVLKAIGKKLMQPSTIPKIPALIRGFSQAVDTNLPMAELVNIAQVAAQYDASKLISQTLPGYFLTLNGISYWGVDPVEAKKVTAELFNQGIVVGNTPDKLIQASNGGPITESSQPPLKPPASVVPTVSIGSITVVAIAANSVTLHISASSGIDSAELYRNGQPIHGWRGGAISYTDTGLGAGKTYTYGLKIFRDGTALTVGASCSATTASLNSSTTPPTAPEVAPLLNVTSPSDGITTALSRVAVSGMTDAGNLVAIVVNGENVFTGAGTFSYLATLVEGPNTITVTATDVKTKLNTPITLTVIYQPDPPPLTTPPSVE
ncbi:MAG: LCP family protein [Peptococcaceae bacterium]|nr:LCP family protein [Peptococcaceae bacterium]